MCNSFWSRIKKITEPDRSSVLRVVQDRGDCLIIHCSPCFKHLVKKFGDLRDFSYTPNEYHLHVSSEHVAWEVKEYIDNLSKELAKQRKWKIKDKS